MAVDTIQAPRLQCDGTGVSMHDGNTAARTLTRGVSYMLPQDRLGLTCREVESETRTWERPTHLTWYHSWQESHSIMEVSTL